MKSRVASRGFARIVLIAVVLLIVSISVGTLMVRNRTKSSVTLDNAISFEVFRGRFVSSVVESGDMESSLSEEIRCTIKSRGRGGTAILKIVPEGTIVKKGEFLAQLDDSILRDELTQQKIEVATDKASVIQAENDLETAKLILIEYQNGTYQQDLATIQAEKALAEETLRRAQQAFEFSKRLSAKGYITKTQLQADEFAVEKANADVDLATEKLKVFEKYTFDRTLLEMNAEIKKQTANAEAARYTLALSEQRQSEYQAQVDACRIVAPNDGMVVYANEIDGRGNATVIIEEGVMVRDSQPIIRLPDPSQMHVVTKVNDSKINEIKKGMPAIIRLDTDANIKIEGRVSKVASFPMPRRWYQAPIEYEVFVEVLNPDKNTRPGLRAKAEIIVQQLEDQLQAPVSSLVRREEQYYVVVKDNGELEARPVEIGFNNEQFVVIEDGLNAGEEVLIDPDEYLEVVGLPASGPKAKEFSDKSKKEAVSKP